MAKIASLIEDLEKRVSGGEWQLGEELPSRSRLAKKYGVSPATVSIAVRGLEEKGLVRVVPSKGVYVGGPEHGPVSPKTPPLIGLAGSVIPSREEITQRGVGRVMAQAILDGIWEGAHDKGQPIVLMPALAGQTGFNLEDCRSLGLQGLILIGASWYSQALQLRRSGFPIILANQPVMPTPVNFVDYDNAATMRKTVDVFVQAGHQRIGVICSKGSVSGYFQMMKRCFVEATLKHDLVYNVNHYWHYVDHGRDESDYTTSVEQAAENLLSMPDPPTAILCWDPCIMKQMQAAIQRRGLKVPANISLICNGYVSESEADCTGFLATHRELGQSLLDHLLAAIQDPFYCVQNLIPTQFLDRGTVGPPKL